MTTKLPARVLVSLAAAYSVAYFALDLSPLALSDLASRGMTTTEAGATVSCLTVALALSSALSVRFVVRWPRRDIARIGLLVGAGALALAAFAPSTWMIPAAMFVGGAGVGVSIAAGSAALAATPDPDSTTSTVTFVNRIGAAGLVLVLPLIGAHLGVTFGVYALLLFIASFFVTRLPDADSRVEWSAPTPPVDVTDAPISRTTLKLAMLVGAGAFLWCLSEDMVYALTATVATDAAGISDRYVGIVLSLSMVGGIVGTLLSGSIQAALGRRYALVASVLLGGVMKFVMITATSSAVFATAMSLWGFAYVLSLVYIVGWAASIDVSGRASTIASACYLAGFPLTPLIGGFLAEHASATQFALAAAVPSLLVALLFHTVGGRRATEAAEQTAQSERLRLT